MYRILIIEDDSAICAELSELLKNNGYEPVVLSDFAHAKAEIDAAAPDLILLDINIPHINGEALLKELRKSSDVPVIMVTSRNSEADEALSISYGADDYVTKPYNPSILLLRIGAVLKRANADSATLSYKGLEVNLQKGTIKKGEREIELTKNEMIIFYHLLQHQNQIVAREDLMMDLWNNNEMINDNALTVNISRLRAKLGSIGIEKSIDTRKGMGYILQ